MAYIQCKHCGAQMSDKSEACPVCGTPVNGELPPELPQEATKKPLNKWIIVGSVAAVILIGAIVGIVAIAKNTGTGSSIYKPLADSKVEKLYQSTNDYGMMDYQSFYSMVRQMADASEAQGEADKYKKLSYKRVYNYIKKVYGGYDPYSGDWEYDDDYVEIAVPEGADTRRDDFQREATKQAKEAYEKQYRQAILSALTDKKIEWENYIDTHTPTNYLRITPRYDYKVESGFWSDDYRPSFYFEVEEPRGTLSDANVTIAVLDDKGDFYSEPQSMSLSALKYYNSDEYCLFFSKVDNKNFWKSHSIKIEIQSIQQGRLSAKNTDLDNLPAAVRNYLNHPNYFNESEFIRQYVKADYPHYAAFVEDYVHAEMRKKDELCFDFLQAYSPYVTPETEAIQEVCTRKLTYFYSHTKMSDRYSYVTRRFFDYTEANPTSYLFNNNPKYEMPNYGSISVEPYPAVKNAYRVKFGSKYEDGYVVMQFNNGDWKIDNVIFKTSKKPNKENALAIDYSQTTTATAAVTETPQAPKANPDDEACVELLTNYYTANAAQIKKMGGQSAFETKRFIKYTKHLEFVALTNTQDFGVEEEMKVESVFPNSKIPNSYIVRAQFGYATIEVCVIMKKESGKWKIDNVSLEPYTQPFIDYSKPESQYDISMIDNSIEPEEVVEQPASKQQSSAQTAAKEQVTEEQVADDAVYLQVEQMPEFPGGQAALFKYLSENVKYPATAQNNGTQGRVICSMVVDKDGTVTNVEVARSAGDASLDEEAVRVIQSMPRWTPGKKSGTPVRVKYTIPITFKL